MESESELQESNLFQIEISKAKSEAEGNGQPQHAFINFMSRLQIRVEASDYASDNLVFTSIFFVPTCYYSDSGSVSDFDASENQA